MVPVDMRALVLGEPRGDEISSIRYRPPRAASHNADVRYMQVYYAFMSSVTKLRVISRDEGAIGLLHCSIVLPSLLQVSAVLC